MNDVLYTITTNGAGIVYLYDGADNRLDQEQVTGTGDDDNWSTHEAIIRMLNRQV